MAKLFISETESIELSETSSLSDELATRQRCDYWGNVLTELPDPDEVLRKMGKDISVYNEMLLDPQVASCWGSRRAGTQSRLWEIDRGKSKSRQAKAIEKIFGKLKIKQIMEEIVDCRYWGMSALEIVWGVWEGLQVPIKVIGKPTSWFAFDSENNLLLKTREKPLGELVPEKKFLLAQNHPRYINPYGERIAAMMFWYLRFKKNGIRWWIAFLEKFGSPWLIGKTPRGVADSENQKVLAMLDKMVRDAVAVVPNDSTVEALDLKGTAASDLYERMISYCDASISKVILGHSAAADSTAGKLGNETMALEAREDLIDADSMLCEEVLGQLIAWICEVNWGENVVLPGISIYKEEDVDQALAERDQKLTSNKQIRLKAKYYQRAYGFEDDEIEEINDTAPPAAPGVSAAGSTAVARNGSVVPSDTQLSDGADLPADQADVDAMLNLLTPEQLQGQMEKMLQPVIDLIEGAASYEDIQEKLAVIYPKMDDSTFQKRLALAMSLSAIRGRVATE
jgi:phage gp29-like protein